MCESDKMPRVCGGRGVNGKAQNTLSLSRALRKLR
jgi:hypothetical protein